MGYGNSEETITKASAKTNIKNRVPTKMDDNTQYKWMIPPLNDSPYKFKNISSHINPNTSGETSLVIS